MAMMFNTVALVAVALMIFSPIRRGNAYEIHALNGGAWGDWTSYLTCKSQTVAGFELRVEGSQGRGDDTALNAISLVCLEHTTITPHSGNWGSWGMVKLCH